MKCKCGGAAIYYRRFEGAYYCEKCLCNLVEKTFRETVRKNGLIKNGDTIAIGISGGKDSSVLLYLMRKVTKNNPKIKLLSITIDEGIKKYRNDTLKNAKNIAKKLGVKHYTFSFKKELGFALSEMPKVKKYCTYCGVFRRYLLNKKAFKLGANKLAVAHTLDDEAQSVIMNFVRGDMLRFKRLGADPVILEDSRFVHRIKPLRDIPEKEVVLYALINKISFPEKTCPYSSDNVRKDVQNVINELEEKYPGTKMQIVRFYDKLRPKIIERKEEQMKHCKCGEPTSRTVCKACELLEGLNTYRRLGK